MGRIILYIVENNIHVPNHQPVNYFHGPFSSIFHSKLLVYRRLCESDLNFSQKFFPVDLLGWFFASSVSYKLMMGTNRLDGHKSDGRWPFGSYDHLGTNLDKLIYLYPTCYQDLIRKFCLHPTIWCVNGNGKDPINWGLMENYGKIILKLGILYCNVWEPDGTQNDTRVPPWLEKPPNRLLTAYLWLSVAIYSKPQKNGKVKKPSIPSIPTI